MFCCYIRRAPLLYFEQILELYFVHRRNIVSFVSVRLLDISTKTRIASELRFLVSTLLALEG